MRAALTHVLTWFATRLAGDGKGRLTPDITLMPEMVVVADGYEGHRMLRVTRDHDHLSVYWPGRGEAYLAGRTFGRVTISADAKRRLSQDEWQQIAQRMATFGPAALWLEF